MKMRSFLPALVSLGLLFSVASRADDEPAVHIFNWIDYFAEDTLGRFKEATGITPVLDSYEANEILESNLKGGGSGYDLVFPTARPFGARQIKAGLYRKLDKDKLPQWGNLDTEILKSLADVDPGNQYLVPYLWGTSGLGLNADKVRAALGEVPLDTWGLIFDPANAKKLAPCGIDLLDDPTQVIPAVLAYLGKNPYSLAPADLDEATQALKRIRPYVRGFHAAQHQEDLANGAICVTHGYSGDVIQAQTRAEAASDGVNVLYVVPREGAPMWVDVMAVPKDAPHPEAAHTLINFLLDAKVIAGISNFLYSANPNRTATQYLDEALRHDPGIYPPKETRQRLTSPPLRTEAEMRLLNSLWARIKANR